MAELRITIGNLSAAVTTADKIAIELVEAYIAQYGGPQTGTPQVRLRWFANRLAEHIKEVADYRAENEAAQSARQAKQEERRNVGFTASANGNGSGR